MRMNAIAAMACIAAAAAAPAAEGAIVQPQGAARPAAGFPVIYFPSGSSEIGTSMLAVLDQFVSASSGSRFILTGHADRVGPPDLNMRLSLSRVASVRRYLMSRGVSDRCIETAAMGERRPAVETADGVDEPANRRVDVELQPGCSN